MQTLPSKIFFSTCTAVVSGMAENQTASSSDEASTYQRLHPRAYLERFLEEGIRTDGRKGTEWREVALNVGKQTSLPASDVYSIHITQGSISTADGSALVAMGETTVVCGVKAEIAEPALDRDQHGFIGVLKTLRSIFIDVSRSTVPNIDLPAMCSPKFKPGPPSEESQILSDRLYEILTSYVH